MSEGKPLPALLALVFVLGFGVVFYLNRPQAQEADSPRDVKSDNAPVLGEVKKEVTPVKTYSQPPEMQIDTKKDYRAVLKTTKGDITVDLFEKDTPVTVNNFVFLANDKFYDGTRFHRVIKGFMIQGGDPLGNGTGGPGYKFKDEPVTKEYKRGIVAMANAGPNTNGSQFFIMHADYPLPKNYVIFGQVVEGLDVVDKIAATEVKRSPMGEMSAPTEDTLVTSVEVSSK